MPQEDTVDIICLANSRKMRHRCIAGLRLDDGGWVRPVSSRTYGELQPDDCCYEDGTLPEILDVASFVAAGRDQAPHQPENLLVDEECYWRKLREADADDLSLVESWVETGPLLGCQNSKIPYEDGLLPPNSLCLVEPRNLRFAVRLNHLSQKLQTRARFDLQDAKYDLPITDIGLEESLLQLEPGTYRPSELGITDGHRALFVVSLGDPYNGYCYKLVAGMIVLNNLKGRTSEGTHLQHIDAGADRTTEPADGAEIPGAAGLSASQIALLDAIGEGLTYEQVLARNPDSTYPDIFDAARAAAELARATAPRPTNVEETQETYPRANSRWTPEEEQRLLELRGTGARTTEDLAEALGRPPGAIRSRLEKLGYFTSSPRAPVQTNKAGRLPARLHLKPRIDSVLQDEGIRSSETQEIRDLVAEEVSQVLREAGFAVARSLGWCCLETGEHYWADVVGLASEDIAVVIEIDDGSRSRTMRRLSLQADMGIAAYWVRWGASNTLPSALGLTVPDTIHLVECPTDHT